MISTLRLHHFTRLQLAQCVFEIGEGAFCFPDSSIVPSQYIRVIGSLAKELRCLEDLALSLYPLVDILYLLVQLGRLV